MSVSDLDFRGLYLPTEKEGTHLVPSRFQEDLIDDM